MSEMFLADQEQVLSRARTGDIAELRKALRTQMLLAEELAHRNRNLLAVLSILLRQALLEVDDVAAARVALDDLTARLADGHSAHTRKAPRALRELARDVLSGFEAGPARRRISICGPDVVLDPQADQLMAMLLFELGTNAVKHGALGAPDGKLSLNWMRPEDGSLRMLWRESGGRAQAAATVRLGDGTELMQQVRASLGARISVERSQAGICIEIALPNRHVRSLTRETTSDRALVVEDNPLIAADLTDIVRGLGVGAVDTAFTIAEARDALQARAYDHLLLDVCLDEGSSAALLPLAGTAQVIVVSGRTREELPRAFSGMPLLCKPFQVSEVAAALGMEDDLRAAS